MPQPGKKEVSTTTDGQNEERYINPISTPTIFFFKCERLKHNTTVFENVLK